MLTLIGAVLSTLFLSLRVTSSGFPKPLSPEEEEACLRAVAEGDLAARNKLVEHNLRLVSHIIKKYYFSEDSHDDLVSIGTLGLIKATDTFRPEKSTRFATYAARCVENEIFMYFRSLKKHACEVSLDTPLETDGDGSELDLADAIGQDGEEMIDRVEEKMSFLRLHRLVQTVLDPRERHVIVERYGLGGRKPCTQREIARRTGLSRSYISRIEKKALQKLEQAFLF